MIRVFILMIYSPAKPVKKTRTKKVKTEEADAGSAEGEAKPKTRKKATPKAEAVEGEAKPKTRKKAAPKAEEKAE